MINVAATVVKMTLKISASIEDLDHEEKDRLALAYQKALNCFQPRCFVELRFSAASVNVEATMTIPNNSTAQAPGANNNSVATEIAANAANLAAMPPATITATLEAAGAPQITVESATQPTVVTDVVVPLAVAPPPPPLRSPSPPPSLPPPVNPSPSTPPRVHRTPMWAPGLMAFGYGAAGTVVLLVGAIFAYLWHRRRSLAIKPVDADTHRDAEAGDAEAGDGSNAGVLSLIHI